jgi:hypothetical protein
MSGEINVSDVIKRLQDVMAANNANLKKAIGGAVDLDTVLDRSSIAPMSFQVAYVGSTPAEQTTRTGAGQAQLTDGFAVYVVINVKEFNGRSAQSMIPTIKAQLLNALWMWAFGGLNEENNHYPMEFKGDSVEYFDRGRYVHSFLFTTDYQIDQSDAYQEGNPTPFDSLYSTWIIGEDEDGNQIDKDLDIVNIYNEGEPLV